MFSTCYWRGKDPPKLVRPLYKKLFWDGYAKGRRGGGEQEKPVKQHPAGEETLIIFRVQQFLIFLFLNSYITAESSRLKASQNKF